MGCSNSKKVRLFMAGDSTMQIYKEDETPQRGWGQCLPAFFDTSRIEIINEAVGGRSTKRYKNEGRWDKLVAQLQKGDFVIIQFAHNDASKNKPERYTPPDDYKQYLIDFVKDVRSKNAVPILCTPIVMRRFTEDGHFKDGHGLYPGKMREVAKEYDVLLINMHKQSMDLISELGPEASKKLYMNLEPGEHFAFPEGKEDNTHMQEKGAMAMARLAVKGILKNNIEPLVSCLKKESLSLGTVSK
jgi:lysophospholipase L1-like esterase